MKVLKSFYLDVELVEILKREENQTKIINNLLREWANEKHLKTLNHEEREKVIKLLDKSKEIWGELGKYDIRRPNEENS
jgi:hypothetical protein